MDALVELAGCYGISPDYHDIWGAHHDVPAESLVSLLRSMGVEAGSETAIHDALAQHAAHHWQSLLPLVLVVRTHQRPWYVRLNLPAAMDAQMLHWELIDEAGGARSGMLNTAELRSAERADLPEGTCIAREWWIDLDLPLGYYTLHLTHAEQVLGECLLIVAPPSCFQAQPMREGDRVWGAAVQLYGLRSASNWGMGDYRDLATAAEQIGARGGSIVGINPLHALYPHNPWHCSPYSPSSRLFKNVLYLNVESISEFETCEAARVRVHSADFQACLQKLRDEACVNYAAVAVLKFSIFELLYQRFRDAHLARQDARAQQFRDFQLHRGEALRRHALFEALQEQFHRQDPSVWGWPVWPPAYRDPRAAEVAAFEHESLTRIEFYEYLQWQADVQLHGACQRAQAAQMSIGLYEDLAVSIDRGGAEVWAHQSLYALDASVGAPPDDFNLKGQNWGLPPLIPERLCAARYAPFIATLRANMRHSGALRIDHVMGLARLFWVPPGHDASYGAYVRYPFDDMLGILALESHRHRCMVIGEDLGTVPDEVRAALKAHCVLSYRLLYFERRADGNFKAPAEYLRDAIVAVSTHDLPTLSGWWSGRDIALRAELNLFPDPAMYQTQMWTRGEDRARLLAALAREGHLPEGVSTDAAATPEMSAALAQAIMSYLAASPAKVAIIQWEDVLQMREQANLPGTTDEHPNWRRKLPLALEQIATDSRFAQLAAALCDVRARR